MDQLRTRYQTISFRGRLLLLLLAVSLVQVGVAGYTFFDLRSEPAKQRVQAQLNAALRGIAPVIDAQLEQASDELRMLQDDQVLRSAIERGDWAGASAALKSGARPVGASGRPSTAYITDADGKVVSGEPPTGAIVEQVGRNAGRLVRGSRLLATIHVPVVVDNAFLVDRVGAYVPKGVDVFVADDSQLISNAKGVTAALSRPRNLRSGTREIRLYGKQQLVLAEPLLDGRILIGASIPASDVKAQQREGFSALLGFVVILGLMTVGMAWLITRAVADALRRFATIARELADGRLERRIPVRGNDEIAVLSTSINAMAENLQSRIELLVGARLKLRRQVELFGDALANATDVTEMLNAVCSLALESTSGTHARFWTIDDDGHYEHAACIGLRPGDSEPCGLERSVSVQNRSVLGEGEPHWLVTPARLRDGQILGLLTVVSTVEAFGRDDVRMVERVAVQAAVAIENARMHEQLRLQATRDGLTGLPNHRSLQDELARRLGEAETAGMPLGVALLDIDNFKRVNDTYGHPIGDEAIKSIGHSLAQGIGGMGMVGRYGGEEFVVILPGCDADTTLRIVDRMREDITRIEVPLDDGGVLRLTASFGVANVDQQRAVVSGPDLLHQADVGLYNAKRTGKNRCYLAGPDSVVIEMSEAEKAKLAARERGDIAAEQAAADAIEASASSVPAPYDPFDLAA